VRLTGRITFEQVTFGYDPQRPVVRAIAFTAQAGEMSALVGPTGSGKTTLVNLLAKYYLPQSGTIRLDGTPLNDWTTASVRRRMGIVLQQNFLFQGTVAENIRFGQPEATDEEVRAVCRALDCLDLLEALPEGLQTEVGERGAKLSLGQRQLVCFARSLLIDPRILILDEATSSIDVQTEQRLQQALQVLIAGRTSFVVAHRLSTIRRADRILMLEDGAIVEQGTHAELIAHGGAYAHLYARFAAAGWQGGEEGRVDGR
jgi:ATP-binding cassette subfamily B protein